MKLPFSFVALIIFSLPSFAGDEVDSSLALQYLEISRMQDTVTASIDEYERQFTKDAPP